MKILITGGAGFVGSQLAVAFKAEDLRHDVVVLDNLHRRGSELNLPRFKKLGIDFVHGDIRQPADLDALPGNFDLFIEASAEPSVLAGLDGSPDYLIDTNLTGTVNCLNFARNRTGGMIYLSTSRVYSIPALKRIPLTSRESRFEPETTDLPGLSADGIDESFSTREFRSLYGATKLASEMLVEEYVHTYDLQAVINRCGVIAGPGQFGKIDQGIFSLWVVNHYFEKELSYFGFGGKGLQVRDLLHPLDLFELIRLEGDRLSEVKGRIFNVGGGREISTSLSEYTGYCRRITGHETPIGAREDTADVDIPWYITDARRVREAFGWAPTRNVETIVRDIHEWIQNNEGALRALFA